MSNNTRSRARYRRIYEKYYGPIPVDVNGISYDIHHIDGDHTNNYISNLKAVTIQEHYELHYAQQDWGACFAIANRMRIDPKEKSRLLKEWHKQRLENGTHNLLGKNNPSHLRVENGTHNFCDGGENIRKVQNRIVAEGKHIFQDSDYHRENFMKLKAEGRHQSQIEHTCPYCGKQGRGNAMKRHHMNNCKHKKADD